MAEPAVAGPAGLPRDVAEKLHGAVNQALRQAEDTHVDALWEAVPRVGGTLLAAHFPRSYIDPNRAEHDIETTMLADTWPGKAMPTERTMALGNGLVCRLTPTRQPIYTRKLSAQELAHRIDHYWRPYRAALAVNLATGLTAFGLRSALIPLFVIEGLKQGPSLSGWAFLVAAAVQAVFLLPAGRLTDLRGRRPAMIIGTRTDSWYSVVLPHTPRAPRLSPWSEV